MYRDLARQLRADMTPAERFAWRKLRGRGFAGYRFRRQAPIGPYIADFVCHEAKLIVKLDGSQHADPAGVTADGERTRWFRDQGFRLARFWNHVVLTQWNVVESEVYRLLSDPTAEPFV